MLRADQIKVLDMPYSAEIYRTIAERPSWVDRDVPVEVDHETFLKARDEVAALQRGRGWPVASANLGKPNFLLAGVPVVPRG